MAVDAGKPDGWAMLIIGAIAWAAVILFVLLAIS